MPQDKDTRDAASLASWDTLLRAETLRRIRAAGLTCDHELPHGAARQIHQHFARQARGGHARLNDYDGLGHYSRTGKPCSFK